MNKNQIAAPLLFAAAASTLQAFPPFADDDATRLPPGHGIYVTTVTASSSVPLPPRMIVEILMHQREP